MTEVAVITGCSAGGIGHALAIELHESGKFRVFATARTTAKMDELAARGIEVLELDVTRDESVDHAIDEILRSTHGVIDVLINNAGILSSAAVMDLPLSVASEVYETNVIGMLRVTQKVGKEMIKRRSGKIVNIGSVVGLVATPFASAYAASKAALHSYTDALRMELAPFGIQVLLVAPGAIRSNIASNTLQNVRFYFGIFPRDMVENRLRASQQNNPTKTEDFARDCAAVIQKKTLPSYFIAGARSLAFRICYHFPTFVTDYLLRRRFGLLTWKP